MLKFLPICVQKNTAKNTIFVHFKTAYFLHKGLFIGTKEPIVKDFSRQGKTTDLFVYHKNNIGLIFLIYETKKSSFLCIFAKNY